MYNYVYIAGTNIGYSLVPRLFGGGGKEPGYEAKVIAYLWRYILHVLCCRLLTGVPALAAQQSLQPV